ncbi:hypothetical protein KUTeg_021025 [Tegillarca granosa]|uniref:Par3/HAL N-terminal domain-containing protein n=1 Tax=Tegillarca granosa TaxID=220873 RepID=A0ABQ9EFK0_TEGGR|nr:hypothetical protein KUTeg_021025 [Tegillarca granosa]
MKLSVRIRGDWFAVPCKGTEKISWLGDESLRRHFKTKGGAGQNEKVYEVRKAKGGAILDVDDPIRDVLDDSDFVTVVLASDMSSPVTGPAEPVYVEEKMYPFLKEKYLSLDGNSVGPPLSPERTRMLLACRINILAKGYSGISLATLKQYIAAFNASCLPWVPEKGTVGASGDLAPLAHLALGMMGEGKMWSPKSGWADAKYVLEFNSLEPIKLGIKEGIALINGTQLISALGAEAVERADCISRQADIIAAFTLDVLKGTTRAFDSKSHRFCDRVQDAYTLRCCPQALDYLAIAVHELANMSERRIERLVNPALSELPAFLTPDGGLNSGFMMAHCTAASLVLAIELLAACQAIEFLRPLKTTPPLEEVYRLVRTVAA